MSSAGIAGKQKRVLATFQNEPFPCWYGIIQVEFYCAGFSVALPWPLVCWAEAAFQNSGSALIMSEPT